MLFSPADILLPDFPVGDARWTPWAVVACDQFTSEAEYWDEAARLAGDFSALSLILPEAWLNTPREKSQNEAIAAAMQTLPAKLKTYENTLIYLERTLPDGAVRRGLVGKIDLDAYDFTPGSKSPIRATEATVVERIPPREAIRRAAEVELPHVLLLAEEGSFLTFLASRKAEMTKVYDFDLMLGGGHVCGYAVTGALLDALTARLSEYENARAGGVVYAVGDGNHSLAAAKAHYEHIRASVGDAASHPARYALCELVSVDDPALVFEPIYRVVTGCTDAFLLELEKYTEPGMSDQTVTVVTAEGERTVCFTRPDHALTVGTLQKMIDRFLSSHPDASCDYIHGEAALRKLASRPGTVGFLFDGIGKDELFPYVEEHGVLPRKTFSMGEARSKRYYIEARRIK